MSDPFPAIAEAAATGETAELFADIRATVGVRVVNLVWRHLATLDGALPWAWAAVKPLYLHGHGRPRRRALPRGHDPASAGLARRRRSPRASTPCWRATTIPTRSTSSRSARWSRGCAARPRPREMPERGAAVAGAGRGLAASSPRRRTCRPRPGALVLRLNRFGDRPQPLILASMYRHLAHAPAFPAAAGGGAGSRSRHDGSLDRAISANRAGRPRSGRGCWREPSRRHRRPWPDRSRAASQPSSITPSARWSRSAGRSA